MRMTKRPDHAQCSHAKEGISHHQISIKVDDGDPQNSSPVTTSLQQMMEKLPPRSIDFCIYRAPKKYSQGYKKIFTPQLVSVGPFHHDSKDLRYMEKHKPAYVKSFLDRSHLSLHDIVMLVKGWETKIRNCYTEEFKHLNSEKFVKMIVLDSCFVIELVCGSDLSQKRDYYLSRSGSMMSGMRRDLVLLENQLPFFVLEGLYYRAFPNNTHGEENFRAICLKYLEKIMLTTYSNELLYTKNKNVSEINHILDLLRMYHASDSALTRSPLPRQHAEDNPRQVIRMHRAKELRNAGMAIQERKASAGCYSVSDISYTEGVLDMPKIIMNSSVEYLLRNLLAYERCHYKKVDATYVTDYLHFLDDLIDTSEDVDVLIRQGIVENLLSDSGAVATLLKDLRVTFHTRTYLYANIRGQINDFCADPFHKCKASLMDNYFGSPWLVASTIAAALLFILTVIQTYCSVISVRGR